MRFGPRTLRAAFACALLALSASIPARATNTLQTLGWLDGDEIFSLSLNGSALNGVPTGGFVGRWNGTPIVFWCAELTQYFNVGNTYSDYTVSLDQLVQLNELFGEAGGVAGSSTDNSAAFQLAVWEILYDNGPALDVSSGNFYVTKSPDSSNAIGIANGWLSNLSTPSTYTTFFLFSPSHQNFITGQLPPLHCCSNVPEPNGALLVVTAGLIVAGMRRRRSKRRAAS